jgi:uncharacterized repeat protein (TIGR03943 family)
MNRIKTYFTQYWIVLGLAIFLTDKLASGKLNFYINTRFFPLTGFAIVVLLTLAIVNLLRMIKGDPADRTEPNNKPALLMIEIVIFISILPILAILRGFSGRMLIISFLAASLGAYLLILINKKNKPGFSDSSSLPAFSLIVLIVPLMIGILSPEQPLSSSSLSKRGISLTTSLNSGQESSQTLEVIADDRTILDWIKLFNYADDHSTTIGENVNVIGFVYHDSRLENDQFMVSRFVITCCAADAFAIGMPVDGIENMDLADNTWVNVKGTLDILTIADDIVPMIHAASIEIVAEPEQPYLYP